MLHCRVTFLWSVLSGGPSGQSVGDPGMLFQETFQAKLGCPGSAASLPLPGLTGWGKFGGALIDPPPLFGSLSLFTYHSLIPSFGQSFSHLANTLGAHHEPAWQWVLGNQSTRKTDREGPCSVTGIKVNIYMMRQGSWLLGSGGCADLGRLPGRVSPPAELEEEWAYMWPGGRQGGNMDICCRGSCGRRGTKT